MYRCSRYGDIIKGVIAQDLPNLLSVVYQFLFHLGNRLNNSVQSLHALGATLKQLTTFS